MHVHTQAGVISFAKNGKLLGDAFTLPNTLKGQVLYPAVCLKNAEMGFNFGEEPFKQTPPAGYVGLSKCGSIVASSQQQEARAMNAQGVAAPPSKPLAVILEPTRDLAEQTHNCVTQFIKHLTGPTLSNALLVGGEDKGKQAKLLKNGVDIVTGTVGR